MLGEILRLQSPLFKSPRVKVGTRVSVEYFPSAQAGYCTMGSQDLQLASEL